MKNKEFWKGAVAGALVVACISVGAYVGADLATKDTILGDRKLILRNSVRSQMKLALI